MNIQNKIKNYSEYGFTDEKIVDRIGLDYVDLDYVHRALNNYNPKTYKDYTNKRSRIKERNHGKIVPWCELLWHFGVAFFNKSIKKFSMQEIADICMVNHWDIKHIFRYFGLKKKKLPKNALALLGYVPKFVRHEVDRLDHGKCIRCSRGIEELPKKRMDYHIVDIEKAPLCDNVVTLCYYCHTYYVHNYLERQKRVSFKGFTRKTFENVIKHYYIMKNEPFSSKYDNLANEMNEFRDKY